MPRQQQTAYAESLSFLLSQVGARSAQIFAEHLAPLGVSPRAYGVLSNLTGSGTHTQQQLADVLGMHRNNMVGLIDELEAAGLVRRHRSEQDRRAFDIRLTRAGSALVTRVNAVLPSVEDSVAGGLRGTERRTMVRLLTRLAESLELTPGVHPNIRVPSPPPPGPGAPSL